jgi:tartrate-resistant acid phosphatase type 5
LEKEAQSTNQANIAKAMGSYAETFGPSFIIAAGDNFYTLGVSSTSDSNWKDLWSDVYLPYTSLQVPWHAVFGK